MSRDSNVLRFRQLEAVDDPLTELAREGAAQSAMADRATWRVWLALPTSH